MSGGSFISQINIYPYRSQLTLPFCWIHPFIACCLHALTDPQTDRPSLHSLQARGTPPPNTLTPIRRRLNLDIGIIGCLVVPWGSREASRELRFDLILG